MQNSQNIHPFPGPTLSPESRHSCAISAIASRVAAAVACHFICLVLFIPRCCSVLYDRVTICFFPKKRFITESVTAFVDKLLNDNELNIDLYTKNEFITAIAAIPREEREEVITNATKLWTHYWKGQVPNNYENSLLRYINEIAAIKTEKTVVTELALQLTSHLNMPAFSFILQPIAAIPPDERAQVVQFTTQLISPSFFEAEIANFFKAISAIPRFEREDVIQHAAKFREEGMRANANPRMLAIIKAISAIPSEERALVIDLTQQLLNPAHRSDRSRIIQAITALPPDDRKDAVENAMLLFTENMSEQDRVGLISPINSIATIDKQKRAPAIAFALQQQLITDRTNLDFRKYIAHLVAATPLEQRNFFTIAIEVLSRKKIMEQMIHRIVDDLPEEQREEVVKNAFILATIPTANLRDDDMIRIHIIRHLSALPQGEGNLVTELTLEVIEKLHLGVQGADAILEIICGLQADQRADVIAHALQIFTPEMHADDATTIIAQVAEVRQDRRDEYVRDRLAGVVRGPEGYRRGINVHERDRDDKTKEAMELLYQHQGVISPSYIDKGAIAFATYLANYDKDAEKQSAAFRALFAPREEREQFGPFIGGEPFTLHGFPLTGAEVIGRLWIFASHLPDEKDQINAKLGMISALADCYEGGTRVCDQGKTQRLAIAVLQGNLEGVMIDDQAKKPTIAECLALFFNKKQNQEINNFSDLQDAAENFCNENPAIDKLKFITALREYAETEKMIK